MNRWLLCLMVLVPALAWADLENEEAPRREVAQRPTRKSAPPPEREVPAQVMQQDDLFEQMRSLSGRVDAVENMAAQLNANSGLQKDSATKDRQALEQKFVAYEDALKKLEVQIQALSEEVKQMKLAQAAPPPKPEKPAAGNGKADTKTPNKAYEEGEALFTQKKYKEAILAYEKYRDQSKKGKFYADATYKMGACFQEMGMKDEARIFFNEVTEKFPGSKEAKKAAVRAKQLK